MCYRPIRISNKTTHYRDGIDPVSLLVPCGKCEECRKQLHNSWFVRAYAEALKTWDENGKVFFFTLTYAPDYLPWFHDCVDDCRGCHEFRFPCFDKTHLDRFRSKLRVYMQRKYNCAKDFRFFITSEFGTIGKRPHYHVLLYLPAGFGNCPDEEIKKLINKSWIYGYVGYTPYSKGGPCITNERGIRYVCKYVTKDIGFFENAAIKAYKDLIDKSRDEVKQKAFRAVMPRHFQSVGFGYDVLKECFVSDDSIKAAFSKGFRPKLSLQYYKIPRYIIQKLCYHTNDYGAIVLNDLGRRVMAIRHRVLLDDMAKRFEHDLSELGVQSLCFDTRKCLWFKSSSECVHYVRELMGHRNWRDLASYALVYRDRHVCEYHPNLHLDCITISELTNLSESLKVFSFYREDDVPDLDVPQEYIDKGVHRALPETHKSFKFNHLEQFRGFDTILNIYQLLKQRAAQVRAIAHHHKDSLVDRLREWQFNSPNIYGNAAEQRKHDPYYFSLLYSPKH